MVAAAKPEARLSCSTSAQRFQFLPLLDILLLQSADARKEEETFFIIFEAILDNMWFREMQCHGRYCRSSSVWGGHSTKEKEIDPPGATIKIC